MPSSTICLLSGSAAALRSLCSSSRFSNAFLRSFRVAMSAAPAPCASALPRASRLVIKLMIDLRTPAARADSALRERDVLLQGVELVAEREQFGDEADNPGGLGARREGLLDRDGQRFLVAVGNRLLELVYLRAERTGLVGRRAAAFVLRERVERVDARLVEIEFALRALNFGRDQSRLGAPALWRAAPANRLMRARSLFAAASSVCRDLRHIAQAGGAGSAAVLESGSGGARIGLGEVRRLRARVLESQLQDLARRLAVIGKKKRLVRDRSRAALRRRDARTS